MEFQKYLTVFWKFWILGVMISWILIYYIMDSWFVIPVGLFLTIILVSATYNFIRSFSDPAHIARGIDESILIITYSLLTALIVFVLAAHTLPNQFMPAWLVIFWVVAPAAFSLFFAVHYLYHLHDFTVDFKSGLIFASSLAIVAVLLFTLGAALFTDYSHDLVRDQMARSISELEPDNYENETVVQQGIGAVREEHYRAYVDFVSAYLNSSQNCYLCSMERVAQGFGAQVNRALTMLSLDNLHREAGILGSAVDDLDDNAVDAYLQELRSLDLQESQTPAPIRRPSDFQSGSGASSFAELYGDGWTVAGSFFYAVAHTEQIENLARLDFTSYRMTVYDSLQTVHHDGSNESLLVLAALQAETLDHDFCLEDMDLEFCDFFRALD